MTAISEWARIDCAQLAPYAIGKRARTDLFGETDQFEIRLERLRRRRFRAAGAGAGAGQVVSAYGNIDASVAAACFAILARHFSTRREVGAGLSG